MVFLIIVPIEIYPKNTNNSTGRWFISIRRNQEQKIFKFYQKGDMTG